MSYCPIEKLQEAIEAKRNGTSFKFPDGGAKRLTELMQAYMKKRGLTLRALAERGGLHDTFASTYNAGRAPGISVKTIYKFAKAMEREPLQLARYILTSELSRAPKKAQEIEIVSPAMIHQDLTNRGVMLSINGAQVLVERVHKDAPPAIVEHAGWRMTLIPV